MSKHLFITLVVGLLTGFTAVAQPKKLNIVFIGNSITHGAGLANPLQEAPPVMACHWLKKALLPVPVAYSNQGVNGATTVDFLPATNTLFKNVVKAANTFKSDKAATLVFSMILGTNDSACEGTNGAPVSPADYAANVKSIMDRLLADYPGCLIVLHRPIWYSPNTQNGARYLAEGLTRLQSYFPVLDKIVKDYQTSNPGQVFRGDVKGFVYFKEHPELFQQEQGRAGIFRLHPNKKGAAALGLLWGKAIKAVVK